MLGKTKMFFLDNDYIVRVIINRFNILNENNVFLPKLLRKS